MCTKLPIESYVNIKGEYGETAMMTLSTTDSDDFIDYQVTSSKFKKKADENTIE